MNNIFRILFLISIFGFGIITQSVFANSIDVGYIATKEWNQITNAGYSNTLSFSKNGRTVTVETSGEGGTSKKTLKASFASDTITIYNFAERNIKLYLRKKNQPFKSKEAQYCDHFSSEKKVADNNYLISLEGYCFIEIN